MNLSNYRKLLLSLLGDAGATGATVGLGSDLKVTLAVAGAGLLKSVAVALAKNEPAVDKEQEIAEAANAALDEVLAELEKTKG